MLFRSYQCAGAECETIFLAQKTIPMTDHKFGDDGICEVCKTVKSSVTTKAETAVVDGKNKVIFTSHVEVNDSDAEIVEMGILYITAEDYTGNAKEDLMVTLDANGTFTPAAGGPLRAKQFNVASYPDLTSYVGATVTINLGTADANKERKLYARGYVIVKKNNTYEIRYAQDVVNGTFNAGFVVN